MLLKEKRLASRRKKQLNVHQDAYFTASRLSPEPRGRRLRLRPENMLSFQSSLLTDAAEMLVKGNGADR
jgi:hypothetical protein